MFSKMSRNSAKNSCILQMLLYFKNICLFKNYSHIKKAQNFKMTTYFKNGRI